MGIIRLDAAGANMGMEMGTGIGIGMGTQIKIKSVTKKSQNNNRGKDLLRMEMNEDKPDEDGEYVSDDDIEFNGEDEVDLRSLVVIEDPKKSGDSDSDKDKIKPKKLIRTDWLPWWDLLAPRGFTMENIHTLKDRHCGNCARGMRATSMRYKRTSQCGCGIAARVHVLEENSGWVRVVSHCSGNWHDYPEGIIEMDQNDLNRKEKEKEKEKKKKSDAICVED